MLFHYHHKGRGVVRFLDFFRCYIRGGGGGYLQFRCPRGGGGMSPPTKSDKGVKNVLILPDVINVWSLRCSHMKQNLLSLFFSKVNSFNSLFRFSIPYENQTQRARIHYWFSWYCGTGNQLFTYLFFIWSEVLWVIDNLSVWEKIINIHFYRIIQYMVNEWMLWLQYSLCLTVAWTNKVVIYLYFVYTLLNMAL